MRITAFNSSPKAEKGNTHFMVEAFLEGAKEAGAEVEIIFLAKKNIKYCLGCFSCWTKTPGKCAIKDDMAELLAKYMASNIVILATPLYCDNVNGIMKVFIDRSVPIMDPRIQGLPEDDPKRQEEIKRFPKLMVMSNCGDAGQENFEVLRAAFKRWGRYPETKVIAEIYRDEGVLLTEVSLMLKPILWGYRDLLKKAGREIVENMKLSDKTLAELQKPLIPIEQYKKGMKEYWEKLSPKENK